MWLLSMLGLKFIHVSKRDHTEATQQWLNVSYMYEPTEKSYNPNQISKQS